MLENINSGVDYAQIVINTIIEEEKQIPIDEQMPEGILKYLKEYVEERAIRYYSEYIIGKRETFLFNDVDLMEMFNKAGEAYVGDILDGLVDKDMLQVGIDEQGEIVYSLSEQGKKVHKKQKNGKGKKPKRNSN